MTWVALLLTILIETAIVLVLVPRRRRRLRVDAPLLNATTQPLATFAVAILGAPLLAVEVLVVLAEGFGYHALTGLPAGRALGLSLVANLPTAWIAFALAG